MNRYLSWLLLVVVLNGGCSSCGERDDYVAELVEATGNVERDHEDRFEEWETSAQGDRFFAGDGLRTKEGGSARVKMRRGGALRMGENAFIRFLKQAPEAKAPSLQIDTGDVELEGGEHGVKLKTPVSEVFLEKMSALSMSFGAEGKLRFEVSIGKARYMTAEDETHVLEKGQQLVVDIQSGKVLTLAGSDQATVTPIKRDDSSPEEETTSGGFRLYVKGTGAELRTPGNDWSLLKAGDANVEIGSRLRLDSGTTVDVRHGDATARLIGAAEAAIGGPEGSILKISSGIAMTRSGGGAVILLVPGGKILLRPNSRSWVKVGRGSSDVRATSGAVEVVSADQNVVLGPGATATVARSGGVEAQYPPAKSTFSLRAGTSAIVHDPRPPLNLAVRIEDTCPGGGVLEYWRAQNEETPNRVEGEGRIIVRLATGAYQYRVYCSHGGEIRNEPSSSGRVRILHDPGTTPMGVPGHNTVRTDGRTYTILFQNLPPRVSFAWPNAPESPSYSLHIKGSSGLSVTKRSKRPRATIGSGVLGEGSYSYFFTTAEESHSPQSKLKLRLDTLVSIASIREPINGKISPGSTVKVSGVARAGAKVHVGGKELPFSGPIKFSGEAIAPTEEGAISIKVSHPSAGVHYFLRRVSGGD